MHDPRSDPQPGDELRDTGQIRRVVKREGDRVLVEGPRTAIGCAWIVGRSGARRAGAAAVVAANQERNR